MLRYEQLISNRGKAAINNCFEI